MLLIYVKQRKIGFFGWSVFFSFWIRISVFFHCFWTKNELLWIQCVCMCVWMCKIFGLQSLICNPSESSLLSFCVSVCLCFALSMHWFMRIVSVWRLNRNRKLEIQKKKNTIKRCPFHERTEIENSAEMKTVQPQCVSISFLANKFRSSVNTWLALAETVVVFVCTKHNFITGNIFTGYFSSSSSAFSSNIGDV